ncbi:MAG TPA: hypothetical protein VEH27_00045 [Methylomirabilota bacterium]|nr:hypothetical protein [Methylomirabilota bacterium]
MGSKNVREAAIIPMTPNEDHTGKEGYAVKVSSGKAALVTGTTDDVFGVILDGEATTGSSSIALVSGGLPGTVSVKLDGTPGTVNIGTNLTITATGTFKAATTGAKQCARAVQSGAANELIEAVLYHPITAP